MKFNVFSIVAIILIAAFGFFIWQKLQPETPMDIQMHAPPAPAASTSTQSGEIARETIVTTPPPEIAPPPALSGSDDAVRSAAANVAPKLAQWLTPPEQIRKWVSLVDAFAGGDIPSEHLPFDYRISAFTAEARGDKFTIDKNNFKRAKPIVDAIVAIPPERLLQYYQHWHPLLDNAYRELGRRDNFDARLRDALTRIEAAQPLPENTELTQAGVYYVFTDPKFEKASELQKLMWRIGPDNARRVQDYARKFRESL